MKSLYFLSYENVKQSKYPLHIRFESAKGAIKAATQLNADGTSVILWKGEVS
jgi:hypothetical protein